jgi:hypothetical protein
MSGAVLRVSVIVLALVMTAAMLAPTLAKFISMQMFGSDYFVIAKAMGTLTEISYWPSDPPFAYPPTTKLFLWPLAFFQTTLGYILFTATTAGAFLYLCRNHLSRLELALIPLSFPFINAALIGQPTFLVVALLLLGLTMKDRRWAGLVLAVAGAVKFQLVLFVPLYLIATRDWQALRYGALASLAILMASVSLYGDQSWLMWPGAVGNYAEVIANGEVIRWVITPIGMAIREGLPVWPIAIPCILAAVALPFLKYDDPIEALFGLSLAALLVIPLGCPDNMLGLVPLLARRIARGSIPETVAYSLYFPGLAVLASFAPIGSILLRGSDGWRARFVRVAHVEARG